VQPARITNLWSKIAGDPGRPVSRVVIESLGCPDCRVEEPAPGEILLTAGRTRANMYCQTIDVYDGLLEQIRISEENGRVLIRITANHPAAWELYSEAGIPHRTVLTFSRNHLPDIFRKKVLVIDPGHGGPDSGSRGPVDLLEKNVVLQMAESLDKLFKQVELQARFTRRDDRGLTPPLRYQTAVREKADAYIGLHTHHDRDENICGLAVLYNPRSPRSRLLAGLTAEELARKIKRPLRGVFPDRQLVPLGEITGITVEPVTISNWVEEGLLRNPTFYEKIALGIFNGLRRLFTEKHNGA